MKILLKTYTLLIIGLATIHAIGCGDVNTELEPEDPEFVDETVGTDQDKARIQPDGKPITITDATFETVVLNAETAKSSAAS